METSKQCIPDISIIIPVLDETDRINSFLAHLKAATAQINAEIIVVDGNPDCGTLLSISDAEIIKLSASKGRAKQMNAGTAQAKGKILLFLHADTILDSQALEEIKKAMAQNEYVGGAFEIEYDSDSFLLRLIAMRSNLRCRISRIPYGDQGIFIRKEYFERIGGFSEFDFLEDVDLMRRIKRDGKKICILKNRITASPRRWQKEGILYCAIRNNIMVGLFHFGVNPNRLAKFYKAVN